MAKVYNPLYFSLVKSLYDNEVADNQFVASVTETGHMFQISAQGFQKITGISWADWQAQHDTTAKVPTNKVPTTESETTDKTTTEVTSKVPDSDNVIQ